MSYVSPKSKGREMRQELFDILTTTPNFTLPGRPIPLARTRFSRHKIYDVQSVLKKQSRLILQEQLPSDYAYTGAPKSLSAVFFMPIPNYTAKYRKKTLSDKPCPHFKRPDLDNLIKFLLDVANNILYSDDSLIAHIDAYKIYDPNPRTEFTIIDIPEFVKF